MVRYRASWLGFDSRLWCIDATLSRDQWDALILDLKNAHVAELPNLVPRASHAMTYLLKLRLRGEEHAACAYGVENIALFPAEQIHAGNWRRVISALLAFRKTYQSEIQTVDFSEDGMIDWASAKKSDAGLSEKLNAVPWW